ncbi:MAG: tetratricopeptide repeat protein [Methanomassiliicoccales archaeon]
MNEGGVHDRFLTVDHGKLALRIPLAAFDAQSGRLRLDRLPELKEQWVSRYPWLSRYALDTIVEEAEETYQRQKKAKIDSARPGGVAPARPQDERHELIKALLKDPDDSRAWYALGELLMKQGQQEDGFKAMNLGRAIANRGPTQTMR